ncbi:phosphoribosylglycinamide formyltransferase [Oceanobacillus sp. FSL K6-2867]|uniref:phosphoribosylglycinamide formyltransferase n=1 Tax=Oceanobacillus sp. FSL K6-2867 TaxID=2954748 RepID=UPI0030D8E7D0
MSKIKAAIFASGTGSNFEAIMETEHLACDIALLVCDQSSAGVIAKADKYGIPAFVFDAKQFPDKTAYEKAIIDRLEESEVSWIFLAGYMRIAGPTLLNRYEGRIVNIHPSLLPAFPGMDAIGQAYRAGVKTTGVTVHFIDEGIDTGPIIAQEEVAILQDDTEESLTKRVHKVEHQLYPKVINQLLQTK